MSWALLTQFTSPGMLPLFYLHLLSRARRLIEDRFPGYGHIAYSGLTFLRLMVPLCILANSDKMPVAQRQLRLSMAKLVQVIRG
jgi:hypothetical protein